MRGVETGKNGAKTHLPLKMDFLLTSHHGVHRRFCASGHDEAVYRDSSGYVKMTPFVWCNCNVVGGAIEPFCAANVRELRIAPFPTTTGVPAKIGVFGGGFANNKNNNNNNNNNNAFRNNRVSAVSQFGP